MEEEEEEGDTLMMADRDEEEEGDTLMMADREEEEGDTLMMADSCKMVEGKEEEEEDKA